MVTKSGLKKLFNPSECDAIPMDVDDDEPVLYPKSLASMPEDQRMSFSDLDEAYDMREWLK
jgi:hypothetical protein